MDYIIGQGTSVSWSGFEGPITGSVEVKTGATLEITGNANFDSSLINAGSLAVKPPSAPAAPAAPNSDFFKIDNISGHTSETGTTATFKVALDATPALPAPAAPSISGSDFFDITNISGHTAEVGTTATFKVALDATPAPPQPAAPKEHYNKALDFDGSNDYVDLGEVTINFAKADFSIEINIKTTAVGQGILIKNDGNTTWSSYEKAFYINSSGKPSFVGYGNSYIHGNTAINDGEWHHIAVVWDYSGSGSSGTGKIYVDGTDDTHTSSYSAIHGDESGNTIKIGSPNYGEAPNYFSGKASELRIWNKARTQTEIQANMNKSLTGSESGLVAYYKMNDGSGTSLADKSTNSNTGTLYNMTDTDWVDGNANFSGSSDFFDITNISGHTSETGTTATFKVALDATPAPPQPSTPSVSTSDQRC